MKTERINGHPVRCFDNGGRTADRYTVVYMDLPEGPGLFGSRGMSADPFHPQGVGIYCAALPGRHLGKRVPFSSLPAKCQKLATQDLA